MYSSWCSTHLHTGWLCVRRCVCVCAYVVFMRVYISVHIWDLAYASTCVYMLIVRGAVRHPNFISYILTLSVYPFCSFVKVMTRSIDVQPQRFSCSCICISPSYSKFHCANIMRESDWMLITVTILQQALNSRDPTTRYFLKSNINMVLNELTISLSWYTFWYR